MTSLWETLKHEVSQHELNLNKVECCCNIQNVPIKTQNLFFTKAKKQIQSGVFMRTFNQNQTSPFIQHHHSFSYLFIFFITLLICHSEQNGFFSGMKRLWIDTGGIHCLCRRSSRTKVGMFSGFCTSPNQHCWCCWLYMKRFKEVTQMKRRAENHCNKTMEDCNLKKDKP